MWFRNQSDFNILPIKCAVAEFFISTSGELLKAKWKASYFYLFQNVTNWNGFEKNTSNPGSKRFKIPCVLCILFKKCYFIKQQKDNSQKLLSWQRSNIFITWVLYFLLFTCAPIHNVAKKQLFSFASVLYIYIWKSSESFVS